MVLSLSSVYTLLSCLNLLFIYLGWWLLCFLCVDLYLLSLMETFQPISTQILSFPFSGSPTRIRHIYFLIRHIYLLCCWTTFHILVLAFCITFWVISLDLSSSWQVLSFVTPSLYLNDTPYFKFQWWFFSILRNFLFLFKSNWLYLLASLYFSSRYHLYFFYI